MSKVNKDFSLEDEKVSLPTFKQIGIPKDIQIKLLHTWNEDLRKEGIIPEELYLKARAKIDRL